MMARSPYLTFQPARVALSLLAGLVVVTIFAVSTKALVEGTTDLTYTIHWFETVPVLVLLVAFVVNARLNERGRGGEEDA